MKVKTPQTYRDAFRCFSPLGGHRNTVFALLSSPLYGSTLVNIPSYGEFNMDSTTRPRDNKAVYMVLSASTLAAILGTAFSVWNVQQDVIKNAIANERRMTRIEVLLDHLVQLNHGETAKQRSMQ